MRECRIIETTGEEPFELRNDPPAKRKAVFESERTRQLALFVGLDDLPGQTYLVPETNLKDD